MVANLSNHWQLVHIFIKRAAIFCTQPTGRSTAIFSLEKVKQIYVFYYPTDFKVEFFDRVEFAERRSS